MRRLPVGLLDRFFDYPGDLGKRGRQKLGAFLEAAADDDEARIYELLISLFDRWDRDGLYLAGSALAASRGVPAAGPAPTGFRSHLDRVLWLQYATWLPDNILARQDKMSMANSVESRIPFLDHVLVEFLASVPPHLKLRSLTGANKILAREYARRLLPQRVAGRPKRAFYIPTERYFSTPIFREMVGDCLGAKAVLRRGYFDPAAVTALVRSAEQSSEFVAVKQVLALVMLEMWHRIFIDREAGWGLP